MEAARREPSTEVEHTRTTKTQQAAAPVARAVQRRPSPLGDFGIALRASPVQLAALDSAFGDLQLAVSNAQARQDAAVHQHAAAGLQGASGGLPHLDRIQSAFGRHDVSHVQAKVGGAAADACAAIGAQAYASGDRVAFAGAPSLHTAAHEAAHVVQQRAGVSLAGGLGRAGDPYEVHADRVADAVVQGKSAEGLLDQFTGGGGGPALQKQDGPEGAAGTKVTVGADKVSADGMFTIPLWPGGAEKFKVPVPGAALSAMGCDLGVFVQLGLGKCDLVIKGGASAGPDSADVHGSGTLRLRGEVELNGGFTMGESLEGKVFARARVDATTDIASLSYSSDKGLTIGAMTGGISAKLAVGFATKNPISGKSHELEVAAREYKKILTWQIAACSGGDLSGPSFGLGPGAAQLEKDIHDLMPGLAEGVADAAELTAAILTGEDNALNSAKADAGITSARTFAAWYGPTMAELEAVQAYLPEGAFNNCRSFYHSWWEVRDAQGDEAAEPLLETAESYKATILQQAEAARSAAEASDAGGGVDGDTETGSEGGDADSDVDLDL